MQARSTRPEYARSSPATILSSRHRHSIAPHPHGHDGRPWAMHSRETRMTYPHPRHSALRSRHVLAGACPHPHWHLRLTGMARLAFDFACPLVVGDRLALLDGRPALAALALVPGGQHSRPLRLAQAL